MRGAGFVWSAKLLPEPGRLGSQTFHVTDWLPTLLEAAGGNPWDLSIDGMNLWDALKNNDASPRTTVLHNIDNIYGISAITHRDYKLIKGSSRVKEILEAPKNRFLFGINLFEERLQLM